MKNLDALDGFCYPVNSIAGFLCATEVFKEHRIGYNFLETKLQYTLRTFWFSMQIHFLILNRYIPGITVILLVLNCIKKDYRNVSKNSLILLNS